MALYGGIELPDRPDPENIRKLDLLQLPMLRDMQRAGFRIDPEHFRALSARLNERMSQLRLDITSEIPAEALDRFLDEPDEEADDGYDTVPPEFNVESSKQVADLLYEVLHLDRTQGVKIRKTKGGERLTTGKKTLEQLKRAHPIVRMILEYRECSKLDGTYARTMPRHAKLHPKGKDCPLCRHRHYTDELRVHTQLLTTRAVTGRVCSKGPNLSNIPIKGDLGREVRAGFIASEGHVLVDRDWAQIELRLTADLSGDAVMIQVYLDDGDIHARTADEVFGSDAGIDKVTRRICAKQANFSVVYGVTAEGMYDGLCDSFSRLNIPVPEWLTIKWCQGFLDKWFGTYRGARIYLDREEEKARRFAVTWTRCGRVRRIPNVRSVHSYIQEAGIREGNNHGIQGFSADLMKLAMGELHERLARLRECGVESYPLLTIYDQMIVETPEDEGETIDAAMEEVMEGVLVDKTTGVLQSKVPIKSDGHISRCWTKE